MAQRKKLAKIMLLNSFQTQTLNTLFRNRMQQSQRMKAFSKFAQNIRHLVTKDNLEALHQRYYVREFKIWEIDYSTAINLFFGIITRTKRNSFDKNEYRWVENELRLFVWTISFYTLSKNIDIHDLSQQDWDFFLNLFPTKQKILFEYQASNLLKNHNQYKKWIHEEDELFEKLVKRDKYRLRWSDLGKALYIESNKKYFRTAKQCRQRWLNHLDPSKLKKYWLQTEDFTIIEYVKFNGKKWACISKKLANKRNQHSIKNRFKSLLTKESKQNLQPCLETELVDSIYEKLLRSLGKSQDKSKQKSVEESPNQNEESQSFVSSQQEHFESHSYERPKKMMEENIYNYEEEEAQIQSSKLHQSILGDISLNGPPKELEKTIKSQNGTGQRPVFEFTKLKLPDLNVQNSDKKDKQKFSEVEKSIRADLFLQEDPFQLLRGYFYKGVS